MRKLVRLAAGTAVFLCAALMGYFLFRHMAAVSLGAGPDLDVSAVSMPPNLDGIAASAQLEVPYISQEGVLPTGCELVSALMLLRYYGCDLPMYEFVEHCVDKEPVVFSQTEVFGPHPADAFAGDPYDANGYGCYAPVVRRALERAGVPGRQAADLSGRSLEELCAYVAQGDPVLVWVTINFAPSREGTHWTDTRTGEEFVWRAQEHCVVLTGYDDQALYFNDPYQSNGRIAQDWGLVQRRYEEMGRQAVALLPD